MIYDTLNVKDYEDDELFKYYDEEYEGHICSDGSERKAQKCYELIYKPIVSIIDIGCGSGEFIKEFKYLTKAKKVVGTDISMSLLKKAQQNNPKVNFYRADSKVLPFKDKEFDLAIMVDLLEHLESPEKSLKEASRVASRILIKIPLEDNLFLNLYKTFVKVDWRNIQGHINFWNSESFKTFIKLNNLNIVRGVVAKTKMVKQPNRKLWFMNVWQCICEIFPDSIKTKLAPSEYYCIVEEK